MNLASTFEVTPTNIAIWIVGFIGLVLFVASFQAKKRQWLLILQTASLITFGAQYLLLGAYVGLILEGICIVRNLVYYFRNNVKWFDTIFTPIVFSILALTSGIVTYFITSEGWICFIPVVANVLQTIGLYVKSEKVNRTFYLFASPLWLIYNLLSLVWFGAATEALNITSIAISLIRMNTKRNNTNQVAHS